MKWIGQRKLEENSKIRWKKDFDIFLFNKSKILLNKKYKNLFFRTLYLKTELFVRYDKMPTYFKEKIYIFKEK